MAKSLSNGITLLLICILYNNLTYALEWPGKWFPQPPNKNVDDNPIVDYTKHTELYDGKHGIKMGIPTSYCDDAKTNLTLDWDNSPINHTCYEDKYLYLPNINTRPILEAEHIPKHYHAPHRCMDTPIFYDTNIPTFGPHRPLWPRYGEYTFVPKQRWLHSLEHGAVVMLYHPCANNDEINTLKKLVKKCLYRHIITPYNLLDPDRPLVLVTWGYRLHMSKVAPKVVIDFIRNMALHGPEQKSDDGQFDHGLKHPAELVTDQEDTKLCPNI